MSEVLLRKDVPAQAKWQTSHVYASQEDWEKDFQWIQEKAKESILAFLKKAKHDSAQRESNRKKQQKKQDMEL